MQKILHHSSLEGILLDDELIKLLTAASLDDLELLIANNLEKKKLIESAYLLLNNIELIETKQDTNKIEEGLSELIEKINREKRKKKSTYYYMASIAAIALILIISYTLSNDPYSRTDSTMLSILDSLEMDTEEIRIQSGSKQTYINDNTTIEQTEEGNLFVGEEEIINSDEITDEYLQLYVPNGKRTTIKFSDGTRAWVNSGSKLLYPKTFTDKTREIYLDGEIYLDVSNDNNRPFLVHTGGIDVKVLGTQFNISAYSSNYTSSVVLVEGKVEVIKESKKEILKPSQGYFLDNNGSYTINTVETDSYTYWKEGIMLLKDKTLEQIVKDLSRYYNVEIVISDKYKNDEYDGKLDLKDSLEEIIASLATSSKFSYAKEENKIIIR